MLRFGAGHSLPSAPYQNDTGLRGYGERIRLPDPGELLDRALQEPRGINGLMRNTLGGGGYDAIASAFGYGPSSTLGGIVGGMAVPTGDAFGSVQLDAATGAINRAAAKWGVPANFLKTIIAQESSGDWSGNNRVSWIRPQSGGLLPYVGLFRDTVESRLPGVAFDSLIGNRGAQIDALAGVLRSQYDQLQGMNPDYNWLNVASYHYSGRPEPNGWRDERGMSNNAYYNQTKEYWQTLEGLSGNTFNPNLASGGGGGGNLGSIIGGQPMNISQGFGNTPFAQGKGAWMYGYAPNYGVQGHAGLDVSQPYGSALYSPVSGTVIVSGGTNYYTDDRTGKGVPGSGELKIKLANGDEIILGHMARINVQVGDTIQPGQLVGTSGIFGTGAHVHVEYRRYTPGATSSGYTAVDPRSALGSSSLAGGGLSGGLGQQPTRALGSRASDASRIVWDSAFRNRFA